jgi:S-adenosylmethionine hydrolase
VKGKKSDPLSGQPLHPTRLASGRTTVLNPLITLLTDFGSSDYFVAAVKGTILSINPDARLVDISHDIAPQDIEAAAFTLLASYQSFPQGTIHLAVVDPGVGSRRRPIMLRVGNYHFVGPDNGIFSYICDQEPDYKVFHLTNEQYFRQPVSATFHGRDIFAPVAAVLSLGVNADQLGNEISDPLRLNSLEPTRSKGKVQGRVIHIDRFGNCITNFRREHFTSLSKLEVSSRTITSFRQFFSEEQGKGLFAIWGSAGFLEISANNASAAELVKIKRGATVLAWEGK